MADLLAERTITWGDATTTKVKIGSDGYFVIDDVKKKLVGFDFVFFLSMDGADWYKYWLDANMAIWEKEMAYLQSIGFRLIVIEPLNIRGESDSEAEMITRFELLFDLAYDHKMLVIVRQCGNDQTNFDSLATLDFDMNATYSIVDHTTVLATVIAGYDNIITVNIGNELNQYLGEQSYTAEAVGNYVALMKSTIQGIVDIPCISNLKATPINYKPTFMTAVQNQMDWQAFTLYALSDGDPLPDYKTNLQALRDWLALEGKSQSGYWLIETNYTGNPSLFTWDYINNAFIYGASVVCLHRCNYQADAGFSFFGTDGEPITALRNIGAYRQALEYIGVLV